MMTRLTGGLAAAALLTAGLACQAGAAAAVDAPTYPQTLDFHVTDAVTADAGLYAAGTTDEEGGTGYAALVGGGRVELGTDVWSVDVATEPDGSRLEAVTSSESGSKLWSIDPATMEATSLPAPAGDSVRIGTDAGGIFQVFRGEDQTVMLKPADAEPVELARASAGSAAVAHGAEGDRDWYVGGTAFSDDGPSTAMLWDYDERTQSTTPVVIGAPGDADEDVLDVAVSPSDGAVYALSFQNREDGPQTYGLSVVVDGQETYYPLAGTASRLAVSPDGQTVYVTQNSSILALDADHLVPRADEADNVRSVYIETDARINAVAVGEAGNLFAVTDTQIHRFGKPSAATGVQYDLSSDYATYAGISWQAPSDAGGGSPDYLSYAVTVTDRADGSTRTDSTYSTETSFSDLVPGHTYDVTIVADNGLFRGAVAASSFTAPTGVATTSSIAITGAAKVGSTLAVRPDVAWSPGAKLTYRWTANGTQVSTAARLVVPASLLGKRVTVTVAANYGESGSGYTSAPTAKIAKGTLAAAKPVVRGTAKVGKTLTAAPGRWTAGTRLTYAWKANGKVVKGATKASLKLTKALKGKKVTVVVTGTKTGYVTRSVSSAPTRPVKR